MAVRLSSLTLAVVLTTVIRAGAQTIAVNGEASGLVSVAAGSAVEIAVSGAPGHATDWIGLFPAGADDRAYLTWSYLSGSTTPPATALRSATVAAFAPVTPGRYEWRLFAKNGWRRIATSMAVTVTASTAMLDVNGVTAPAVASARVGSIVTVNLANGPGNATDWIGLAPAGSPDTTLIAWRYLNGSTVRPTSGRSNSTIEFVAPVSAGAYEVRLFAHDSYERLVTAAMTVSASTAAMTVNGTAPPAIVSAMAGTQVTVGITGGPAHPSDWVGLFSSSAPDSAYLAWLYLNASTTIPSQGQSDAQLVFNVPATPGAYEFRLFSANSFTRLAASTSLVVSASSARLSVNGVAAPASATAAPGSQAVVTLDGGPANRGDWVGLYQSGAADSALLDWRYLNDTVRLPSTGLAVSTLHLLVPTTPGTYEFRFFAAGGGVLSTSGKLVVPQTTARITVNGVAPPTPVLVALGDTLTVHVSDGPGNPTDWVALAAQGTPDSSFVAWRYLNGSTHPPAAGLSDATLSFPRATVAGTYELRLFAQNGFQRITTSSAVTASAGSPSTGILDSPVADPPGGVYRTPQTVTLRAAPGAIIHYTVDGTDPTAASSAYASSISVPGALTVRARAYRDGWTTSEASSDAYVIDGDPPSISARTSPPPNAAGWNQTPVTITFTCADAVGISTCPSPVVVSTDGANQVISRAAIDQAGNETPVDVTVNIDRTPPSLEIQQVSSEVASSPVVLGALAGDSLSGLSAVACNGIASQQLANPFECSVALRKGRNVIIVTARDVAGNVASNTAVVRWTPTGASTSITIAPASAGMVVGEARRFSVKDDQERLVGATWSTSDSDVVAFVDGVATAIAPGTATITATVDGLTAIASLVVYAGPLMPAGAVRWSNPSIGGSRDLADTVVLNRTAADGASLLSIEFANAERADPLVRGLDVNGAELWSGSFPLAPGEVFFTTPIADPDGGVVALVGDLSVSFQQAIVRTGWTEGAPSWRRDFPANVYVEQFKQAGDGTIYAIEDAVEATEFQDEVPYIYSVSSSVIGLDGDTGAVKFRRELPTFKTVQSRFGQNGRLQDVFTIGATDGMAVSSDNLLYLTTTAGYSDDVEQATWRDTELWRINQDGDTVTEQLWQGGGAVGAADVQVRAGNMIADGDGGVFFQMRKYLMSDPYDPIVTGRYRSPTQSSAFEMPDGIGDAQVTSIESRAIAPHTGDDDHALLRSFDMRDGTVDWELETSETAAVALTGGGAVLVDGLGGYRMISASGGTEDAANLGDIGAYAFGRFHSRDENGTLRAVAWRPLNDATAFDRQSATPKYGIMAKAYEVPVPGFKHLGLAIIPRNQQFWTAQSNQWATYFEQSQDLFGDLWILTTGGAPHTEDPLNWKLSRYFNRRNGDFDKAPDPGEYLRIRPQEEDNAIGDLLYRSMNFPNAVLPYEPNPTMLNFGYNSNSFLRGLLDVTQLPAPSFFAWPTFPGAQKPVPANYFEPQNPSSR